MTDDGFVDILVLRPLRREVARAGNAEVDHAVGRRLGKGRRQVHRTVGDDAVPFLDRQIQRARRQRTVAAGLGHHRPLAIGEIVLDRFTPRRDRAIDAAIAQDDVAGRQMIEQGLQPLLEQRQPMLHARQAPPIAHRLIERVAGRIGAKLLAVAGTEPLDALLVEQGLARRHQRKGFGGADGALVGGIERPHRLDLVAEEVEPDRVRQAGGIEVEQAAAHRKFARVRNAVGTVIAIGGQQGDQLVALDPFARRQSAGQVADSERRQRALGRGIGGGHQQLRLVGLFLQRGSASPAARP